MFCIGIELSPKRLLRIHVCFHYSWIKFLLSIRSRDLVLWGLWRRIIGQINERSLLYYGAQKRYLEARRLQSTISRTIYLRKFDTTTLNFNGFASMFIKLFVWIYLILTNTFSTLFNYQSIYIKYDHIVICTHLKNIHVSISTDQPTDRPTDRETDRPTDQPTDIAVVM